MLHNLPFVQNTALLEKRQPVSLYIIKIAQKQPHFAFARYHSTVLVKIKGKKKRS